MFEFKLLLNYGSDVGVNTVVPVEEAFDINNVACLNVSKCLVNVGFGTGEVTLDAEGVVCAVLRNGYIDIVTGLAVLVLNGNNGKTLEGYELVLVLDELLGAEKSGNVGAP